MAFDLLSADGSDATRWEGLIAALPPAFRDIHFLPAYGRIYRATYGHEPLLAVFERDGHAVVQPFVRRSLADFPFLQGAGDAKHFTDIASPYGYGGPLSTTPDIHLSHQLYREFAEHFAGWCERENIASEFVSLHPFMAPHQLQTIGAIQECRHEKDVVVVDLARGEDALWENVRKGHRSSIKLAERAGVTVARVDANADNLALFGDLYYATMNRRAAASRWFFPANYFTQCVDSLGTGRTSLFFATIGERVESAALLMHDFGTAYYHFAATRAEYPELGVNNLMLYATALWAQQNGYKCYHLGGGVGRGREDGLYRFKAGFSPATAPPLHYFCVRNRVVYEELCARKRAFERATTGAEMSSDFLPLYRR